MSKPISQREARALRKQVAAFKEMERVRHNCWQRDYPGGTHIHTLTLGGESPAVLRCATKLGFSLVVKLDGDNLRVYAVKP